LTLLAAIDDATGEVVAALFRDEEDAHGYMLLRHSIVTRHGILLEIYSDRHSAFIHTESATETIDEQLAGQRNWTQVGRLLEDLGLELILALSPQAKGRIERLWGTFQDRLVSELRLGADIIQIPANRERSSYAKATTRVCVGLDGSMTIYYQGRRIAYQPCSDPNIVLRAQKLHR
jgi:hypothetical protein